MSDFSLEAREGGSHALSLSGMNLGPVADDDAYPIVLLNRRRARVLRVPREVDDALPATAG